MKKLSFTLLGVLMLIGVSNAQLKSSTALDLSTQLNTPLGGLTNNAGAGWGTTARMEFKLSDAWSLTVTSGYMGFAEKSGATYSAVPVVAGLKLYMVGDWYAMAETGWHIYTENLNSQSTTTGEWGFGVGSGFEIPFSNVLGLDLSTKYQYNVNNLSYWNYYAGLMFYL
jgi:hypothetical protein